MTRDLEELLVIAPKCSATVGRSKCRSNAEQVVHATILGRPPQRAELCKKHVPAVVKAAEAIGYDVAVRDL